MRAGGPAGGQGKSGLSAVLLAMALGFVYACVCVCVCACVWKKLELAVRWFLPGFIKMRTATVGDILTDLCTIRTYRECGLLGVLCTVTIVTVR